MTVSVIIPVYNQAQYLPDAVESVFSQTKQPDQIIIVDDGSTDGSGEIADSYKDRCTVVHQVNKGLSSARNTGLMHATSDYILPLDSDDILLDNAIEVLTEKIGENDILAPSFKTFGVENHEVILGQGLTLKHFANANYIPYFSLFKRSRMLEVGGYSPRMIWGYEDMHMTIDILKRGASIATIPDVLVLYRTKANSMIHTAQAHHDELMAQIAHDHPELYA